VSVAGEGRLVHHELCFGCGRANLFGLLAELEATSDGAVTGRCFIKQDHQGPDAESAHPGIVATALIEAMSLACGAGARPVRLDVEFTGQVGVGDFLELEASLRGDPGDPVGVRAQVRSGGHEIASAVGSFTRGP
jgi:hypothetical protein